MDFKIDENLPVELADCLRRLGHDAATVPDQDMSGSPDVDLAAACQAEKRALVTLEVFEHAMEHLGGQALENRLWVVEEGRIRIRG